MKELSKVNTQIKTVSEIEQFCKVLWKVNLMVAYPLTDAMIESWANYLIKEKPKLTIEQLNKIIDSFIKGERNYVLNKGITNIFLALNEDIPEFVFDWKKHGGDMGLYDKMEREHKRKYGIE